MSAFLHQLPALIGVVIGALGSYLAVVRSDRARFRHETAARWEERRLAVYADYARTLKTSVTLTYRVAAHLGNDPHPHPLTPHEAARPQAEAALARVRVVAVMEMERFLRDQRHDPEAWRTLLERQRAAREGYYTAVRQDLALPPGHGARWPLPPVSGSR